jgi:hypothetical protein
MNARRLMPQTAHRNPGEDHLKSTQPHSDWARIPAAQAIASLSRSTLYANFDISGGAIKTASIRKRGATRGIRMVSVPSLIAWLDSFAEPSTSADETGAAGGPAAQATNLNHTQG